MDTDKLYNNEIVIIIRLYKAIKICTLLINHIKKAFLLPRNNNNKQYK